MKVDLNKIKLTFLTDSVRREKMSDERYFSEEFSNYISNSRLKLINPDQEGSPELYEKGLQGESTTSLNIGSSVHELVLQPENFELGPDLNKPTAKLGMVIDFNDSHPLKGALLILETLAGNTILVSDLQFLNALFPIFFRPS